MSEGRGRMRAVAVLAACLGAVAAGASAQGIRVEITSRELAAGGQAFGAAGQYEILRGRIHGDVDPANARNRIVQDLDLAPRNARGRVEYVATFALARPVDPARASGVLVYRVVNRGNGDVDPNPDGHVTVVSGWQGDVVPTPRNQSLSVPVARQADGSPITGPVFARFVNVPAGSTTLPIRLGSMSVQPPQYVPATLDQAEATLASIAAESADGTQRGRVVVPRDAWAFADCRATPFPGTPDPAYVCTRDGFDPSRVYELTYIAKDPLVLGLGLVATRDLVAFFKHAKNDDAGTPNPVAGLVKHAIAIGDSQSGNFIKTFVHLGFNEDLAGRIVWDGVFPRIAARLTPMNFRFALPGGAAALYEPGSEAVLWWGGYEDSARKRGRASLLDRCTATRTCPKVVEAFGSAEFWGLRMSPGLVGTDAKDDIPLPGNVRRYYYPGTTHGGGRGGFDARPGAPPTGCVLPNNPNPQADTTRALTAALIDWVVRGTPPPPSRYPTLADGDLVPPTAEAVGMPTIPGLPSLDGIVNPVLEYDFGPGYNGADLSGVIAFQPPRIVRVLPTAVPRVNSDGNEASGLPSVLHQVPLGTYLGWNVTASGFYAGRGCGFAGGYVPFAATEVERRASGDPRPSLEERYGTLEGYVCLVRRAAQRAVVDRVLLRDDADRLVRDAAASHVLPPAADSTAAARARADALCAGTTLTTSPGAS